MKDFPANVKTLNETPWQHEAGTGSEVNRERISGLAKRRLPKCMRNNSFSLFPIVFHQQYFC